MQTSVLLRSEGEFEVFAATLDKSGALLPEMERAGFTDFPEYRLASFFSFGFVRQLFACAGYLRRNKIDIVHTRDFYTNVFGLFAATLAGTRVRIGAKRETKGVRTTSQERIERFAFRFAHAIEANAEAVANYLASNGVPRNKIFVNHNGLDFERLSPKTDDRDQALESVGLPKERRFVTLVANLRHGVKNQEMMIRSAAALAGEFADVDFVFAGEGGRKEMLESLADELGVRERCLFPGRCADVPSLLMVSEICVLTSFAEGFSNSILEYMFAGKPVVATDVGGARECIEEGVTGFLIASDDDPVLSDRLRTLLEDREMAQKMGENGKSVAMEKFSSEANLNGVRDLYRRLLG